VPSVVSCPVVPSVALIVFHVFHIFKRFLLLFCWTPIVLNPFLKFEISLMNLFFTYDGNLSTEILEVLPRSFPHVLNVHGASPFTVGRLPCVLSLDSTLSTFGHWPPVTLTYALGTVFMGVHLMGSLLVGMLFGAVLLYSALWKCSHSQDECWCPWTPRVSCSL
jgi:hypothetical protein